MDVRMLRELRNRHVGNKSRQWYSIRNLPGDEAEIFIYDVIGESWFGGVTANEFVRELREIKASKILLRINSPGGDVNDGIAIRNALVEHPATIETHVDGAAYSTASWVALAGSKVVMGQHATMMIHEPHSIAIGDAETMRKEAEMLDLFGGEIAKMYAEKAGGAEGEWRDRMRAETWYDDQGAVDAGLADEVAEGPVLTKNTFDPAILQTFKNTPAELLRDGDGHGDGGTENKPTPTKRDAEDALRDAGLSRRDAKALVSAGWPALTTRDAEDGKAVNEELVRERLRYEKWRAGHGATV
jgi:ATP-dependent protease ClpP protease subunit